MEQDPARHELALDLKANIINSPTSPNLSSLHIIQQDVIPPPGDHLCTDFHHALDGSLGEDLAGLPFYAFFNNYGTGMDHSSTDHVEHCLNEQFSTVINQSNAPIGSKIISMSPMNLDPEN